MPKTKKTPEEITNNLSMNTPEETSDNQGAEIPEETAVTETVAETENLAESAESNAEASGNEIKTRPRQTARRTPARSPTVRRVPREAVLTIDVGDEIETREDREDTIWHDIQNAFHTKKILTGSLGGIERVESDKTIVIVYYKELRVVIPLDEMMINVDMRGRYNYSELMTRQSKILGNMLGADIDFIVKGIDSQSRSIVASRKEAMLKKRQTYYMETDKNGIYKIYEGCLIETRVIAVSEKAIRVDAFGAECSIPVGDLSRNWIGDAHDFYSVGDRITIRVTEVNRESADKVSVKGEAKSVEGGNDEESLKKCKVQGKYAGKVTDVRKGVVFVRLSIGVNAVAHSCYDNKTPGKKDDVSFAVTHIDEKQRVAVGIITRIIRQNL